MQEVAKRAGVTHRTVYNHFPTREALSDALAAYVDERLASLGPAPDAQLPGLGGFADLLDRLVVGTKRLRSPSCGGWASTSRTAS